jgi:transposase InsO family protein
MNAEVKVARQRLSVLELAEKLGNVSEACRRRGVTRTQFYEYKKRFEIFGLEGLADLPPIAKSHPQTTPVEVVEKICDLALTHPSRGCNYLEHLLALEGVHVSAVTIQKILNEHELGSKFERWLALERQQAETGLELTPEQVAHLEKQNPAFRERHVESSKPGELLSQDTFLVGHLKGVGKVYLHAVVDTYNSLAFGFLHTSKQPEAAVALVHNDVLPFYGEHGLQVEHLLTDNGREFCGTDTHPFELYLALNDIQHRTTRVRRPQTNGFVERFHQTVQNEFFAIAFREKFYTGLEALQADLDAWLHHYNYERPHLGYRNQGQRPYDRLRQYLTDSSAPPPDPAAAEADPPLPADARQGPERSGEALAVPLTASGAVYAVPHEAAF